MSLQGTLDTFALPDVLRLVASTRKTGRLRVSGTRGEGSIWVEAGDIVAGSITSVDDNADYATQVFDLLRFPDGSFIFESDRTAPEPGAPAEIEPVLREAEALLAEWRTIEQVIPSSEAWINLAEELPTADVVVDRRRWLVIVAVGAGSTVMDIANTLGLGEIQVARELKEMVELGLLEVGAPTGSNLAPAPAPALAAVAELPVDEPMPEPADVAEPAPVALSDVSDFGSVDAGAPAEVAFVETAEPVSFADQPDLTNTSSFSSPTGDSAFGSPALGDSSPSDTFGSGSFGESGPYDDSSPFGDPSVGEPTFGDSGLGPDPFADAPSEVASVSVPADPAFGDPSSTIPPPPPPPPAPLLDNGPAPRLDEGPADASDPAEVARQLANLSPRAARAVAAAARADTDEEREAALADVDEADEPLNRGLLMKFLSNE